MLEPFAIEEAWQVDGGEDDDANARSRYKAEFPGRSARRMTHLGMLVGLCLNRLRFDSNTPIVYASSFAESRSLERYIDSFPAASPMLFQSSIHPSAVEQVLIPRKQAAQRFYPIAALRNLPAKALELCFSLDADRIVLVGGEERGSWLCPHGLASSESFAFCLLLTRSGDGIGTVRFEPGESSRTKVASSGELAHAIESKTDLPVTSLAWNGCFQIDWS